MSLSADNVLRRDAYREMPWRNGAGTTLEIRRVPAEGADFEWRLSLASIAQNGPFSPYPDYQRSVSLIEGAGFRLEIGSAHHEVLDRIGATALFAGDASTACTLLNGPCCDLSLMVRSPGRIAAVEVLRVQQCTDIAMDPGKLHALFCMAGTALLAESTGNASIISHGGLQLQRHDTWFAPPGMAAVALRSAGSGAAELLRLSWCAR